MVARRRRVLVVMLTAAALAVSALQGDQDRLPAAAHGEARPETAALERRPAAAASPSPSPAEPSIPAVPSPAATASPSPSPSPSPTPKGPPFVIDAAPSCAGRTALIDVQVAATARRPIAKLELILDGALAPMTPRPSYPMRSYAGRSSAGAASSGSGRWVVRATDAEGIAEERPFPYACG